MVNYKNILIEVNKMITIKTTQGNEYGGAEIKVAKGTPHTTMLLGTEMLIEAILKEVPTMSIDDVLEDLRRIYIRDNGGNNEVRPTEDN